MNDLLIIFLVFIPIESTIGYFLIKRGIVDGFIHKKIPKFGRVHVIDKDFPELELKDDDFIYGEKAKGQGGGYIIVGILLLFIPSIIMINEITKELSKLQLTSLLLFIVSLSFIAFLVSGTIVAKNAIINGFIKQKHKGVQDEYLYGKHAKIVGALGIVLSLFLLVPAYILGSYLLKYFLG